MVASQPHYLLFSESQFATADDSEPSSHGSSSGGWRFVLETVDGSARFEAADDESAADDCRLALLALVRGLEALDQPSRVTLLTRSRYVNRGLRFGLQQWRENGWCWERFGEMAPIKNQDLWQRVDSAMRFHQVECRKWRIDGPHQSDSSAVPTRASALANRHRMASNVTRKRSADPGHSNGPVGNLSQLFRGIAHRIGCLFPHSTGSVAAA